MEQRTPKKQLERTPSAATQRYASPSFQRSPAAHTLPIPIAHSPSRRGLFDPSKEPLSTPSLATTALLPSASPSNSALALEAIAISTPMPSDSSSATAATTATLAHSCPVTQHDLMQRIDIDELLQKNSSQKESLQAKSRSLMSLLKKSSSIDFSHSKTQKQVSSAKKSTVKGFAVKPSDPAMASPPAPGERKADKAAASSTLKPRSRKNSRQHQFMEEKTVHVGSTTGTKTAQVLASEEPKVEQMTAQLRRLLNLT